MPSTSTSTELLAVAAFSGDFSAHDFGLDFRRPVGWHPDWDPPRRRISYEDLYNTLEKQGGAWARELEGKHDIGNKEARKRANRAHRLKWSRLYG